MIYKAVLSAMWMTTILKRMEPEIWAFCHSTWTEPEQAAANGQLDPWKI